MSSSPLVDCVKYGVVTLENFHSTVFELISNVNRNDAFNEKTDFDKIEEIEDVMAELSKKRPDPLQTTLLQLVQTTISPLYYAMKQVYNDHNQSLIDAQGNIAFFNRKKTHAKVVDGHKFALKRQKPDARDYKLTLTHVNLPTRVDLREKPYITPVLDQGNIGSCAAHASAASLHMLLRKQGSVDFSPSRLFLYYMVRVNIEHEPPTADSGCTLRDICKSIKEYHVCDETLWPYDTEKYSVSPPAKAVLNANLHNKLQFCAVKQDLNSMKNCIANGFSFIIGLQIYSSFQSEETMRTGIVTMPDTTNEELLGGHALLCLGFDDSKQHFIIQNSWSDMVGDKGFFFVPYAYMTDQELAGDYWCFQMFE